MAKLPHIVVSVILATVLGCITSSAPTWHAMIRPVPSTQPRSAVDLDTGEPLWHDFADQSFPRPFTRDLAFRILLSTETFAWDAVGYAGTKSVQVDAFQVLLCQPDAVAAFVDLLKRGGTPGQMYALCGLRLLDGQRYAAAESTFASSGTSVVSQEGCCVDRRKVGDLVRSIDPRTARLRPGETVEQWSTREKPGPKGMVLDISGGGIPAAFRDAR